MVPLDLGWDNAVDVSDQRQATCRNPPLNAIGQAASLGETPPTETFNYYRLSLDTVDDPDCPRRHPPNIQKAFYSPELGLLLITDAIEQWTTSLLTGCPLDLFPAMGHLAH